MEFWEDLGKKISTAASNAAGYTVKETEKLTNIAKAKYKITNLKSRLDSMYKQIGLCRYRESLGEVTTSEEYDIMFTQVNDICKEIDELDALVLKYRNDHICEKCGSKLSKEMVFCPKCGAKQPICEDDPHAENTGVEDPGEENITE